METIIITISTDFHNAREACESIENNFYSNIGELRRELQYEYEITESKGYNLTDFMDMINDGDSVDGIFMSYIFIKA